MPTQPTSQDPKHNDVYLILAVLTVLKLLGLNDLAAGAGTALCYYLLWL